ncbi:MAG: argininosuccinate synthase [Armatimonadetes bacterium]|nr:argininosuccinate synthase [Armatimonadota bacterium]
MSVEPRTYTRVASHEARPGEVRRVVLLYSGGLDTSVMLKWIQDEYRAEVITVTLDLGQQADDLEKIRQKALRLGATEAHVIDVKDEFADEYLAPLIKANGAYQGDYYISTVSRPLLAKWAVTIAARRGADTIAHGCTGKGNDQVRVEGAALALNPEIKIIAPVREWAMGRDQEIEYAKQHGILVPASVDFPYSADDNMWGMTWEGGDIEDPARIPPLRQFLTTYTRPEDAPNEHELVKLTFKNGLPVALNGQAMKLSALIMTLNRIAGRHGVGVVHHIEDRVVGLKVRGVYEAPAAHTIITAHRNLEKYVCTRIENELKVTLDNKWSYLVYGGLWHEPALDDINAFNDRVNDKVDGEVTVRLFKGSVEVVAMESPNALYDRSLATFMRDYAFNQNASAGFIEIYSLQMKLANQIRRRRMG